jgi:hypothetical protein
MNSYNAKPTQNEAVTGTTTEHRDEFLQMVQDCEAGLIDLVITNAVITKGQFYKGSKPTAHCRFEPVILEFKSWQREVVTVLIPQAPQRHDPNAVFHLESIFRAGQDH